ncbi:hypothetical protein [Paenibacillus chitinolyticus]
MVANGLRFAYPKKPPLPMRRGGWFKKNRGLLAVCSYTQDCRRSSTGRPRGQTAHGWAVGKTGGDKRRCACFRMS